MDGERVGGSEVHVFWNPDFNPQLLVSFDVYHWPLTSLGDRLTPEICGGCASKHVEKRRACFRDVAELVGDLIEIRKESSSLEKLYRNVGISHWTRPPGVSHR